MLIQGNTRAVNPCIYANEYTDEIVCVSYGRKDIFWTKFFRDCLDASIPNNFDELERVKKELVEQTSLSAKLKEQNEK